MSSPRVPTELSQVRTTFMYIHRWLCGQSIPLCNPSASKLVRESISVLSWKSMNFIPCAKSAGNRVTCKISLWPLNNPKGACLGFYALWSEAFTYKFNGDEFWKTGCRCCLGRKTKTGRGERVFGGKDWKGKSYKDGSRAQIYQNPHGPLGCVAKVGQTFWWTACGWVTLQNHTPPAKFSCMCFLCGPLE